MILFVMILSFEPPFYTVGASHLNNEITIANFGRLPNVRVDDSDSRGPTVQPYYVGTGPEESNST